MKKIVLLGLLMTIFSWSLKAQNLNFDGLRITGKVGLLGSNLNKYYGLADGFCSDCESVRMDFSTQPWGIGNEWRGGVILGGALGYNFTFDNLLVGFEGGLYKTFLEYNLYGKNLQQINGLSGQVLTNLNLDYLADASILLGGIISEKFLLYGKAGLASGYFNYLDRVDNNERAYSSGIWNPGYSIGGGIKYAISNRYALGLEYNYFKFKDLEQVTKNSFQNQYGVWNGDITTRQHVDLQAVMLTLTVGFGKKAVKQPQMVYVEKYCPEPEPRVKKSHLKKDLNPPSHDFPKPQIGKTILLDKIYYDFDQDYIRPDARPELDKVVAYMKEYPNMRIELSSHTDSRGTHLYNENLSQRRAESAVRYIVERGISSNRIHAKGYGENRLVNHCKDGVLCSEEDHQKNRRTEFTILSLE